MCHEMTSQSAWDGRGSHLVVLGKSPHVTAPPENTRVSEDGARSWPWCYSILHWDHLRTALDAPRHDPVTALRRRSSSSWAFGVVGAGLLAQREGYLSERDAWQAPTLCCDEFRGHLQDVKTKPLSPFQGVADLQQEHNRNTGTQQEHNRNQQKTKKKEVKKLF